MFHLETGGPAWRVSVFCLLTNACGEGSETIVSLPADASPGDREAGAPAGCQASPRVDHSPRSVSGVLALINDLEHPVSLSCFLQALGALFDHGPVEPLAFPEELDRFF